MKVQPDFNQFNKYYDQGKTQLVYSWVPADLETPVGVYLKLCHRDDYSFLLESVEGGNILGRYSAIGFDPDLLWRCNDGQVHISKNLSDWEEINDAPIPSLKKYTKANHIDVLDNSLPPMASAGLFGQIGYDMIRYFEDIPDSNDDELDIPDAILMRPQIMVIFDNVKQMMCICTPVWDTKDTQSSKTCEQAYEDACARLKIVQEKLLQPVDRSVLENKSAIQTPIEIHSNTTREQYHKMVTDAVEEIYAGEIFQVVPSQRFSIDFDLSSIELYRSLRTLNPSPFLFHVKLGGHALVGSSPEILVRVRDNVVTIRPIAGTRKRGADANEDKLNAEDLLADEKEIAEHLMLLDLGRNDVGRVSEIGSVEVTDKFIIEYYSHVMHIVSNVEGQLANDKDILDALFAGFPAGTVSGAPKIRAMEIIDELETVKRKFYGGAVGYLGGNGDLDTCIALRTGLVKDGKLYVQAGGGVVADSDPEAEYQESCNKARALIAAAENAIIKSQE